MRNISIFSKEGVRILWSMATAPLRKLGRRGAPLKGAEVSRLNYDWIIAPITADNAIKQGGRQLRVRARDLARNNVHVRQYMALLAANVIGPKGMRLQAQVRNNDSKLAKPINDKIEAAWRDWSFRPTTDKKGTLQAFSRRTLKIVAKDGEALVRMVQGFEGNRYLFGLQAIDVSQLSFDLNRQASPGKNEIRLGVEVDVWGAPVAYHINTTQGENDMTMQQHTERIPADRIIHLYDPEEVNQTRGISWLNSIMLPIKMLEGYAEAELVAARTAAAKMGWLQSKGDDEGYTPLDEGDDAVPLQFEASPGTVETLPPGLEFKEWSPDHPTSAFGEFMKSQLRSVASGLHTSYNALASDLEGVNFSSLRSGLLIERDVWKTIQDWWANEFLSVVYGKWLEAALLSGALVLDSRDFRKFLAIKWQPRGWPWVDPVKDVQANILAVQNGLASRGELLSEKGGDLEEVLTAIKTELELAKQMGINITGGAAKPSASPDGAAADAADAAAEDQDEDGDRVAPTNGSGRVAAQHGGK